MPTGVIINSFSIVVGGILGNLFKRRITQKTKESLNVVLAFSAMTLGLCSLIKLQSVTLVIISILLGSIVGELLHIYEGVGKAVTFTMKKLLAKKCEETETEEIADLPLIVTAVIIFCFSGTGIFGAITEGATGDATILVSKSALDVFTAMILASSIGWIVLLMAVPQFVIMTILFLLAKQIAPFMTENVTANFVAVGGLITIMTGFNLLRLKEIKVMNCLPSLIIVTLLSMLI